MITHAEGGSGPVDSQTRNSMFKVHNCRRGDGHTEKAPRLEAQILGQRGTPWKLMTGQETRVMNWKGGLMSVLPISEDGVPE